MAAADSAGESELANLLQRALALLNVADPSDRHARQKALEALTEDALDALTDDYHRIENSRDLDEAMRLLLPEEQRR